MDFSELSSTLTNKPYATMAWGLYLFALVTCIRVLRQRQSTASTLSWIFILLGMPLLAVPLYYMLGQNRIPKLIRKRRKSKFRFRNITAIKVLNKEIADEKIQTDIEVERIRVFAKMFASYGEVFWPTANQTELLIDGEQTFKAIFRAIDNAKNYIFIQFYILRSDLLGLELKKLLIEKANSGVQVFMLFDDMGSFWLPKDYIRQLRQAGVHIVSFLPLMRIRRRLYLNFRNHRKLVVVDGQTAFTGGLNVGEEYVGKGRLLPYWRDTHLQISGPAVLQLEEIFLDDWFFAAEEGEKELPSEIARKFAQNFEAQINVDRSKAIVQIVPSGPTDEDLLAVYLFMQVINLAKNRLWIATPYFIPNEPIQRAIELAVMRGVDVRILIPGKDASRIIHAASFFYLSALVKKGVQVFCFNAGFMHQKVVLVDDYLSVMGTSNIDNRTLYLNFETTVVILQKLFANSVENMLINDFDRSTLMVKGSEEAGDESKASMRNVFQNVARLLSPLL